MMRDSCSSKCAAAAKDFSAAASCLAEGPDATVVVDSISFDVTAAGCSAFAFLVCSLPVRKCQNRNKETVNVRSLCFSRAMILN